MIPTVLTLKYKDYTWLYIIRVLLLFHLFFTQGYVSRQALYACSTCTPSSSVLAGFCLACSLRCHEGHDVIELYTKRYVGEKEGVDFMVLFFSNFRCDCGNSKISGNPCLLCPVRY